MPLRPCSFLGLALLAIAARDSTAPGQVCALGSGLAFVPAVQWPGQAAQQARAGGGGEMLERIDHVNLVVADMPRMVAFYKDVLGMRLAKQAVISGPWIEAVTGLSPVEAEVAFLEASSGPRIELIRYRAPEGSRPRAPAAPTCKVFGISLSGRRTSTDWSPPWRRPGSKC